MRAIWLITASRARRQWRGWLLLTVLVAVGTGVVLSAVTAGRRADAAFPGFVKEHGYDAILYAPKPEPVATLPNVAQAVAITAPYYAQPVCSCGKTIDVSLLGVREVAPSDLVRMVKLTEGRMADQSDPHQILASFTMERDYGIRPGTTIQMPMAGADQQQQIEKSANGDGPPPTTNTGPTITVRVTGIVVAENEFPSGQGATYDLYPTAAFAAVTRDTPHLTFYNVRFKHGQADFAQFEATANGPYGAGVEDLDRAASAITSAIHPQAVAWWVVAALAAATFLVATGQALARQVAADDRDGAVLTAIGLRSGQFTSLHALRTLVIAVAGTVAGVGVATLLSPLTPVGEARLATPTPGLVFDWPVALSGGAAATAAVLLLGLPPALRSARRQAARRDALVTRQSRVTRAAAAAGLPAAAVLGIRQAFSRGRGANAAPVGTGLTGAVAAVTALCVIAVFGASLSHLLASPELYGDPYTAFVNSGGPGAPPLNHVLSGVEHDRAVDRITEASTAAITVNHVSVRAVAAQPLPGRGPMLLSTSDGLLPTGNGEIELGSATMRSAGAHVGGTVQVTVADPYGKPQTTTLRVVGTGPFPADLGSGGIGEGATLTYAAYQAAQCPGTSASGHAQCLAKARQYPVNVVLLHTVPGPAGDAAIARITAENPGNVTLPAVPTTLASFGESANFPLIVAVVVALGGLAALAHLLAVSVARRRRESGLLKALGFARPQLAATVFWQAVTVGLVGLVLGIPLGLVLGRAIWRLFAGNLGVVPFTVYPGWLLAAIAGGFLLASLVIAVLPARSAARAGTSQLLRAE